MTSKATRKSISSQASADGRLRYDSLAFQTTLPFGREARRASRSVAQAKGKRSKTSGTCGLTSFDSSTPEGRALSLANKLRTRLKTAGSMLYATTWRQLATPFGRPYFRLAVLGHQQSAIGCFGWQTPRARGDAAGSRWRHGEAKNLEDQARLFALSRGLTIAEVARLSVSPTFCRRLMGYPVEWDSCGATAMQSFRKSPPCSSRPASKRKG